MRAVAANLLMDMVEQCRLITCLFYQKQPKNLEATCNYLVIMYRQAVEEGIHESIMAGILSRNLPKDLVIQVQVSEGA